MEKEEIHIDLQADSARRDRMDLLWLDPQHLLTLKEAVERGIAVDVEHGAGDLYERVIGNVNGGKIAVDDLNWALEVDALAAKAEAASKAGDYRAAIRHYRAALRLAPGCDLYIMSIGSCYGHLDEDELALRYLERAAQISPSNPRIARNLAAARSNLPERRVVVSCPHCQQKLRLPVGRSGTVKCPNAKCAKSFAIST